MFMQFSSPQSTDEYPRYASKLSKRCHIEKKEMLYIHENSHSDAFCCPKLEKGRYFRNRSISILRFPFWNGGHQFRIV